MRKGSSGRNYKKTAFDNWSNEFWTMPSKGKPETTKQASIRNFVSNIKAVPSDIKKIAKAITEFHATKGRGRRK